jgi:predicted TIM-barrel fold metal-dependent hydrolase
MLQEGEDWVDLIDTLVNSVVVDHFSRPDKNLNLEDPSWKAVLAAGNASDNVYMKVCLSNERTNE